MNDDEMWDDMVDINGNLHGKHVDDYSDDEVWEVDSDAYSKRSVSSEDNYWSNIERSINIYVFPRILS